MTVEVIQRPALRAACVRHEGPYDQIGSAFGKLGALAGPLFALPGATMIGLYHDLPGTTPPDRLRSDAAVVVPEGTPLPAGLAEQRLPAGRYAATLHVGPYEGLGRAWRELLEQWLPASGHHLRPGPTLEIYLNTPMQVPNDQLKTQLLVPIA